MVKYQKIPLGHVLRRLSLRRKKPFRRPTTRQVAIDLSQFKDGFDPLVKTGYHVEAYAQLASTVDATDQLSKIKSAKKAKTVFNSWLTTKEGDKGRTGKQKPYFYSSLTKKSWCKHRFGECLLGASTKTKSGFKCRFTSNKGSDGYIHHVSVLANSVSKTPIHTAALLKKVSQKNTKGDKMRKHYTLSHLCGNGGCGRPGHILIELKSTNEDRAKCHFFLRKSRNPLHAVVIRQLCPHKPKCFVNTYTNIAPYY